MIAWNEQGAAVVAQLLLRDGRHGSVVLVAPRSNAKGATLLLPGDGSGKPDMLPLQQGRDLLRPEDLVQILAMQERLFGSSGLPRPAGFTAGTA